MTHRQKPVSPFPLITAQVVLLSGVHTWQTTQAVKQVFLIPSYPIVSLRDIFTSITRSIKTTADNVHTYIQTPYFVSYVTAYISSILLVCPAGQYRSDNDVTCQQCPGNTKTEQVAAPLCECLDGYFRND